MHYFTEVAGGNDLFAKKGDYSHSRKRGKKNSKWNGDYRFVLEKAVSVYKASNFWGCE